MDALGRVEGDQVELVVKRLVKRPVVDVTVKHPNGEQPDQVLRALRVTVDARTLPRVEISCSRGEWP